MKKILVFIDWYLPGYKAGGPIRSVANLVSGLSGNYAFYIVSRDTDFLDSKPYTGIVSNNWNKLSNNENVYYISKDKLSIKHIKSIIKNSNCDIAYINGIYSFYFSILPVILLKKYDRIKTVIASRGMLSAQSFNAKIFKKKFFIVLAKLFRLYEKTIFQVTSENEKSDIQKLKLKTIGLHLAQNFASSTSNIKTATKEKTAGELKLVSIARISNEKNTLFGLECLKNFKYNGHIVFDLYGSIYQKDYWLQCKKLISELPENIEVNYKGELNNSLVNSVLKDYHFLFLPTKGENFGHSILESFIATCPVIISNKTPWNNLRKKKLGWDLDLNKPKLFYEAIQSAISLNEEEYSALTENVKNFVINYLENSKVKESYYQLFE